MGLTSPWIIFAALFGFRVGILSVPKPWNAASVHMFCCCLVAIERQHSLLKSFLEIRKPRLFDRIESFTESFHYSIEQNPTKSSESLRGMSPRSGALARMRKQSGKSLSHLVKRQTVRHGGVVLTDASTYWPKEGICAGNGESRIRFRSNHDALILHSLREPQILRGVGQAVSH